MVRYAFEGSALTRLRSVVNRVTTIESEKCSLIRKEYAPCAIETGIALPMGRVLIERKMCNLLSSSLISFPPSIRIPALVEEASGQTHNCFERISGAPLRQLPFCAWPKPYVFEHLGAFLAQLEALSSKSIQSLFDGLETDESEIRSTILNYKVGLIIPLDQSPRLALGDVGLNNILWADPHLYLIDFEFAHRDIAGFDMGQLMAELTARDNRSTESKALQNALLDGYNQNGGAVEQVDFWFNRFKHYYKQKYSR